MKAMGLHKMPNLVMGNSPISNNKGKNKVGSKDDDDEYCVKPKPKKSTPSKKNSKLTDNASYVDDDEALMKAIALSLQYLPHFLDASNKTPPQSSDTNESIAEKIEINPTVQKDDSGNQKRKNMKQAKGELTTGLAESSSFTWKDEEMEHMIHFFDSNENGKLSLEDFTKIVELCNMRQGTENTEPTSVA